MRAGPTAFADRALCFDAPACPRTPFTRFAPPRETYGSEYLAAPVASLSRKYAMLRKKFVALLDRKQHGYSSLSRGSTRSRHTPAPCSSGAWSKRNLLMLNVAGIGPVRPSRFFSTHKTAFF